MVKEVRTLVVYGGGRTRGLTGKGDKKTFWGDGNILYLVWGGNFIGVPLVIICGIDLISAFYHVCIVTEFYFVCVSV